MSDNFNEAIRLLRDDNLVWSDDFEAVRKPLADLLVLIAQTGSHQFDEQTDEIVFAIAEPKPTIPEPLERWVIDSARTLGIYREVAGTSKQTSNAVKRLFRIL